jgi:hypothetical protein
MASEDEDGGNASGLSRWNLGILNDKETIEVPGKQAYPL